MLRGKNVGGSQVSSPTLWRALYVERLPWSRSRHSVNDRPVAPKLLPIRYPLHPYYICLTSLRKRRYSEVIQSNFRQISGNLGKLPKEGFPDVLEILIFCCEDQDMGADVKHYAYLANEPRSVLFGVDCVEDPEIEVEGGPDRSVRAERFIKTTTVRGNQCEYAIVSNRV
ncbi:hypothetical protein DFH07DRAFT_774809 [Mycena maculata]|uniref:Uncharacterized protein n=1 Tax=Mycena maculata TaxID=230809 RepID=A0AAD7IVY2_9AGAR|nr:hypothetical protein DFH07DRAFT_774809 [Mycena maculata]